MNHPSPIIFTKDQISTAARLWKEGETLKAIGEELGIHWKQVFRMADARRKQFPYRKSNHRRGNPVVPPEIIDDPTPVSAPGRVVRMTITGAKITLPRVEFIDGPEWEARVE